MDKRLKDLEKQYKNIPIPNELEQVVERSLKKRNRHSKPIQFILLAAAAMVLFTVSVNTSPTFAKSMAQIPVLSSVVKVLTFTEYDIKDGNHELKIKVPVITGDSKEIQALNAQYESEGIALYKQYLEVADELEEGHYAIESGYEIKTDNDQLLSFGRYVVEIVGSSSTVMNYTTIDKQQQIAITLPSLFKDDRYIELISTYIANQMREEMKDPDLGKIYWVSGAEGVDETFSDVFQSIAANQNFYITDQGKLVISFHKYEVAPGYMGLVEFEIPTDVIQGDLVSKRYIK